MNKLLIALFLAVLSSAALAVNSTPAPNNVSGTGVVSSGTSGQIAYYGATGNIIIGTSAITIYQGNVGIGTATPIYPFQINNGATVTLDSQATGELDISGALVSLGNVNGVNFVAANTGYYSFAGGVNTYLTSPSSAVWQLGQANSTTAVNQTLRSQGALVGNSNVNGGNLTIASGISTGTGTSSIILQTSPGTVGVGTSQNTLTTAVTINGSQQVGVGTSTIRNSATLDAQGGINASGPITCGVQTVTISGSAIATNYASGCIVYSTLSHNASTAISNPTNAIDGGALTYVLTQDGTGTNAITWGGNFDFGAAGQPTISTGAGKVDYIGFRYNTNLTKWVYLGSQLGN